MKTRRGFFSDLTKGVLAASALGPALVSRAAGEQSSAAGKEIRIGIIGAENSHTVTYGRLFNRDKKFPGCRVVGVWGETDEFAKNAAEKGHIPWIVKDPSEFMGKINALIVDHRHAKYHIPAAWPFVEAGIPTFIDKPFCYRVSEGKKFFAMAREKGTPVTSFSTVARGAGIKDMREQVAGMKKIYHIVSSGHCDVESKYGGVFFYGVHQVQRLMVVFGEDIEKVRVTRHGDRDSAILLFSSGYQVTMVMAKGRPPFQLAVVTDEGIRELKPRVESDPMTPYREIVALFREGKVARTPESLLKETAVLEALERSVASGEWEEVIC